MPALKARRHLIGPAEMSQESQLKSRQGDSYVEMANAQGQFFAAQINTFTWDK